MVTYCQNFYFKIRKDHWKICYETCIYESMDDRSLPYRLYLKTREKFSGSNEFIFWITPFLSHENGLMNNSITLYLLSEIIVATPHFLIVKHFIAFSMHVVHSFDVNPLKIYYKIVQIYCSLCIKWSSGRCSRSSWAEGSTYPGNNHQQCPGEGVGSCDWKVSAC